MSQQHQIRRNVISKTITLDMMMQSKIFIVLTMVRTKVLTTIHNPS